MSMAKQPFFAVILERTDGNIGSDRISSQTLTNFLKDKTLRFPNSISFFFFLIVHQSGGNEDSGSNQLFLIVFILEPLNGLI